MFQRGYTLGAQADQVRDDIIARIHARGLRPGQRIDEDEIRGRLGLSGTPIREAIIALEALGLVERRPRAGVYVKALDLAGVVQLLEAHAEAEGALAYRAARRANPAQVARLEAALAACERFPASAENGPDYYDLNLAFHEALFACAGNAYLAQTALRSGTILLGYLHARHCLPGEPERSATEHRRIFQAVVAGNAADARRLMIDHVMMKDEQILDVMNHVQGGSGQAG